MRSTDDSSDGVPVPEDSGLSLGSPFDEQPGAVSAAATTTTAKLFNRCFM
jgi:hypothetical protein